MLKNSQKYLHIFFILAFILVGVSPACEFIAGKNGFIEICSADGSTKKIAVADEFNPLSDTQDQPEHKSAKKDCGFCFANTHLSKNLLASNSFKITIDASKTYIIMDVFSYKPLTYSNFQPRAPPAFLA